MGEKFYFHIVQALQHYSDATSELSVSPNTVYRIGNNDEVKHLSVLCSVGVLSNAVLNTYNKIEPLYPGLILEDDEIGSSSPDGIFQYIDKEKYDILACYAPPDSIGSLTKKLTDYIFIHVIFDELVMVMSKANPLSKRRIISSQELKDLNLIYFKNFSLPKNAFGIDARYQFQTNSHAKALEQIKHSDSYCVLLFKGFCDLNPDEFGKNGALKMVRLDKKVIGAYFIALNQKCMNDPCAVEFVKLLSENFKGTSDIDYDLE